MKLASLFDHTDPSDLRLMTKDESLAMSLSFFKDKLEKFCGTPKEITKHLTTKFVPDNPIPEGIAILLSRIDAFAPETVIDEALVFWCAYLARYPGDCVLWAYALVRETEKNGGLPISLTYFAKTAFPLGVPTDDYYLRRWKEQKRKRDKPHQTDNWLDVAEVFKTGEVPQ